MASSITPLTNDERENTVVGAQSVFTKLRNLFKKIEPSMRHRPFLIAGS